MQHPRSLKRFRAVYFFRHTLLVGCKACHMIIIWQQAQIAWNLVKSFDSPSRAGWLDRRTKVAHLFSQIIAPNLQQPPIS